jgi:hypothetical protein
MTGDITTSNSLADLRERAKAEHAAVGASMKTSLAHAFAAGDILIAAKQQLRHGQWLQWLESCGIPERTAQRYIRLAKNRMLIEAKSDTVSDLGVSGALALLTLSRASRVDLVGPTARLADVAADMAFNFTEEELGRKYRQGVDYKKQLDLMAEARSAIEKIGELGTAYPELVEVIDGIGPEVVAAFVSACDNYRAARAAEMGLPLDVVNEITKEIDALESGGLSRADVARAVYYKFQHEFEDRVSGPVLTSTTDICLTVRDTAQEWLRRVQEAAEAAP